MKRCAKCREVEPKEDFGVSSRSTDGRYSYCRMCYREMHALYRLKKAVREGRVLRQTRPRLEGQKWCPDCQAHKSVGDFGKNKSTRDGLASYCKPCQNARAGESRERLRGSTRHYHLVRGYGLSAADADALVAEQDGLCAICDRELGDKPHVDHDTGAVRGLLCFNCNGGLGQFGDDIERLRSAVA